MIGQDGEHTGHIDPTTLQGVLAQPQTTTWPSVKVGANQPLDGVWLRLTGAEPGTCRIAAASEGFATRSSAAVLRADRGAH
jgi:protein-L-isoaspartate(D-aspartate) O-methyltransferase